LEKKPYARPWAEWTDFSLAEAIATTGGNDGEVDIGEIGTGPGLEPGEVIDYPP
jgi:hypothetical protein